MGTWGRGRVRDAGGEPVEGEEDSDTHEQRKSRTDKAERGTE
jgi:hypothetical protein